MREARGPAWTDWLAEHGVVGLTGVDTRALVLHLREHGAMRAGINATLEEIRALPEMAGQALAGEVSTAERTSRTRTGTCASRSSTTAASAPSSNGWRRPAPRSPSTPTTSTRTSWPRTTAFSSRTGPATRRR